MKEVITEDITWAGSFAILFLLLGIAAIIWGWPEFHIVKIEKHYHNDEKEEL